MIDMLLAFAVPAIPGLLFNRIMVKSEKIGDKILAILGLMVNLAATAMVVIEILNS